AQPHRRRSGTGSGGGGRPHPGAQRRAPARAGTGDRDGRRHRWPPHRRVPVRPWPDRTEPAGRGEPMTAVLVPLGHDDSESLRPAVAEALTIARGLGEVMACATVPVSEALTGQLGSYGVSRLVRTEAPDPASV